MPEKQEWGKFVRRKGRQGKRHSGYDRKYVEESVKQYLEDGGTITKIEHYKDDLVTSPLFGGIQGGNLPLYGTI